MEIAKRAQSEFVKKAEDYIKLSPEEKTKFLDAEIDRQEAARKELVAMGVMPVTRPTTIPSTQPGDSVQVEDSPDGSRRISIRRTMPVPGGDNPALKQYHDDLAKRRAERGLPPSQGGITIRRG